jgi:ankyrin repeat protein
MIVTTLIHSLICLTIMAVVVSPKIACAGEQRQKTTRTSKAAVRSTKVKQLLSAAANGDTRNVIRILATGVNVDATLRGDNSESSSKTALMIAASHGYVELVEELIKRGANPNARVMSPHAGEITPLTSAINSESPNRVRIADILIHAKAEINPREPFFLSPLMHAAGDLEMVKLLVANGANVNQKNFRGATALMGAATDGPASVVSYLIENGADVKARDDDGHTALMYAENQKQEFGATDRDEVIQLLRKAESKP